MANNFIVYQTDVNASMDDLGVTETVAGVTFPSGFTAGKTVMVVINRDVLGTNGEVALESAVQQSLDRIVKKIEESAKFN